MLTDAANSLGERRQLALGALSIAIVLMWDRRDAFGMLATSVVGPFGQFLKTIMERPCPSRKTAEAASVAFCHSYPSGHVIFCTWLGLMLAVIISKRFPTLSPILGLLAIGLVTIMSIARMEAGAHLPSDVAGGIFLAVAWCGFVLAAMRAVPRFD